VKKYIKAQTNFTAGFKFEIFQVQFNFAFRIRTKDFRISQAFLTYIFYIIIANLSKNHLNFWRQHKQT